MASSVTTTPPPSSATGGKRCKEGHPINTCRSMRPDAYAERGPMRDDAVAALLTAAGPDLVARLLARRGRPGHRGRGATPPHADIDALRRTQPRRRAAARGGRRPSGRRVGRGPGCSSWATRTSTRSSTSGCRRRTIGSGRRGNGTSSSGYAGSAPPTTSTPSWPTPTWSGWAGSCVPSSSAPGGSGRRCARCWSPGRPTWRSSGRSDDLVTIVRSAGRPVGSEWPNGACPGEAVDAPRGVEKDFPV